MRKFIDGVHQLWYVSVCLNDVKVKCKIYEEFWDKTWVDDCNAFHTREEAESVAKAVRIALEGRRENE